MSEYFVQGEWQTIGDEWVYRTRALDASSPHRIIGKVAVHVDVDAAHGLEHFLGAKGVSAAENSAHGLLKSLLLHRHGEKWKEVDPPED